MDTLDRDLITYNTGGQSAMTTYTRSFKIVKEHDSAIVPAGFSNLWPLSSAKHYPFRTGPHKPNQCRASLHCPPLSGRALTQGCYSNVRATHARTHARVRSMNGQCGGADLTILAANIDIEGTAMSWAEDQ
ncbi:hypothetical protein PoB_007455800 [Plakobranchus ocellatus]|uniref:Uncharacterized protein n=1 Tax=Plakobranchus ocellatus TaxID=259542 RepID=A0AAV4DVD6_9GAST|nr:hypothetical protein PoB_007455800 [Plakobranchus ocellatus]